MQHTLVGLLLACLFCFASAVQPGDIVYNKTFRSPSDLVGWSTAPWVTFSPGLNGNNALNITVPATNGNPDTRMISTSINVSQWAGYTLYVTAVLKYINVSKPSASYLGVKAMLSYSGNSSDVAYLNTANVYGTADWNSNYVYSAAIFPDVISGSLTLGLQGSSGTVLFDNVYMSVFKLPPSPLPPPPLNPPPPYTGHDNVPAFRGTMSPQTYVDSDIQNLGINWKANVMRWQLCYYEGDENVLTNLTLYDNWLAQKLNETDHLLVAAKNYGIKIVLDLHSPPGGRDPAYGDRVFLNQTYQTHFLDVWRMMATRYKGNPAIWGYDIQNEPLQNLPGNPGVLQWQQLAEATTELIRSIDTSVTLIVSCELGGGPSGYTTLRPVNDDKVVYTFHMYEPSDFTMQGVTVGSPIGPMYPGIIDGIMYNISSLKAIVKPVRDYQLAFNVRIYVGEFSAVRWAANSTAVNYLRDCISIFEEYDWDWTYHAYREWPGWSVEYDDNYNDNFMVNSTARKTLLLSYFAQNEDAYTAPFPTPSPSNSPSSTSTPATTSSPSSSTSSTPSPISSAYAITPQVIFMLAMMVFAC